MRDSKGRKRGALSIEECTKKATALISEHGMCLFLVDLVDSTQLPADEYQEAFRLLSEFRVRASELFSEHMPENELAVPNRIEKGFSHGLGDAAWAAIDDPSLVLKIAELRDREFPSLRLHYGVAADAWSDGVELIR